MDTWKWTDELAIELCEYVGLRVKASDDIRQQITYLKEDFKKSKTQEQEERIKVVDLFCQSVSEAGYNRGYMFTLNKYVASDKFPAIKSAIENLLNGESTLYDLHQEALEEIIRLTNIIENRKNNDKEQTDKQVYEFEEFNQACKEIERLADVIKSFRDKVQELSAIVFKKHTTI